LRGAAGGLRARVRVALLGAAAARGRGRGLGRRLGGRRRRPAPGEGDRGRGGTRSPADPRDRNDEAPPRRRQGANAGPAARARGAAAGRRHRYRRLSGGSNSVPGEAAGELYRALTPLDADAGTHPIRLAVSDDARLSRLTTLARPLLILPHWVW